MNKKFFIFVIALIVLLAFQIKLVMPFVYDIVSSDLFLEDSGDDKSSFSEHSIMTDAAFEQCNFYIANELHPDQTFTFPSKPLNAFKLGNFQYVINADVEILPADSAAFTKKYVCRIKYHNQHDTAGISDFDNWSIDGLSGLENLENSETTAQE